jgi:hypothetical protein
MVDGEPATLVLPTKLYEKLAAVAKEEYEKSDAGLRNNAEVLEYYGDLLLESKHPIYRDEHGTIRWVPNKLLRWVADECKRLPEGGIFNTMTVAFQRGIFSNNPAFSLEEYKEFYRDIGYSLCGFSEIFPTGEDE